MQQTDVLDLTGEYNLGSNYIRFILLKNEAWLALCQVEHHFGEIAIGPGEPGASVVALVVDMDALMNEAKARRILHNKCQSFSNLVIIVGAENGRYL